MEPFSGNEQKNKTHKHILLEKYNVQAPRYTSYPAVPCWDNVTIKHDEWSAFVKTAFEVNNSVNGLSLYIHLPFCESLCTYCGCNTRITVNHGVERPYIDALLKEWNMYLRLFETLPGIRQIHLGGGTPTFFSAENLGFLIQRILDTSILLPDAELSFEAHPANTTREHLVKLYDLGFRRLSLGIQDFDESVQKCINRHQTIEQVKDLTLLARALGYESVNYDLIYGLPLQTMGTMAATISKVIHLKPDRIAFYSYAHVPWIKPGQRSYSETDLPNAALKRSLYEYGRTEFEKEGYVEIGMDHYALTNDALTQAFNSKNLHRNFMGYTTATSDLLVGLGVSSISDTGQAFAQNEKTVEQYYNRIQKGEFPVTKGHILSAQDMVIRKHILNLMCSYETNWQQLPLPAPFFKTMLHNLKEMKKDGLVKINEAGVVVLPEGKPFLRNICMAFDARLHQKKQDTLQFSKAI